MDNSVQGFPVSSKELSLDIKANKTDIVILSYEDCFFVIVTQIGTMGTILHARKDVGVSTHPTFNVSVAFGKRDEPMLVACARQLIEHISSSGSSKSLVLSLSGDTQRDCFSSNSKSSVVTDLQIDIRPYSFHTTL